jgi:hypothetical protein
MLLPRHQRGYWLMRAGGGGTLHVHNLLSGSIIGSIHCVDGVQFKARLGVDPAAIGHTLTHDSTHKETEKPGDIFLKSTPSEW